MPGVRARYTGVFIIILLLFGRVLVYCVGHECEREGRERKKYIYIYSVASAHSIA